MIVDILDRIHPDYRFYQAEAVETKSIVDGVVVTRYRVVLYEKDGSTSFVGDKKGPFEYKSLEAAQLDVDMFNKWKVGGLK
jgi:hypothetical protein